MEKPTRFGDQTVLVSPRSAGGGSVVEEGGELVHETTLGLGDPGSSDAEETARLGGVDHLVGDTDQPVPIGRRLARPRLRGEHVGGGPGAGQDVAEVDLATADVQR